MNYREVILEDDLVLADSGTKTFDINILDPITEILLKYKVQNDTSPARDVAPETTITKIELVDGGQTYLSMTGQEAVAVAAYDKGFYPPHWYDEGPSRNQRISIPIQFGRYIGDPQFAFNPTALRNPQLKFTWAKNALHLTGAVSLGIIAKVMEGVGAPSQCLLTKQVEAWDGAASGVKTVDMFNDYAYRRLFIRSYLADTLLSTLLSHFKLTCDADRLVVVDCDAAEFEEIIRSKFGPFEVRKLDRPLAAGSSPESWIAGRTVAVGSPEGFGIFAQVWASGCSWYTERLYDTATSGGILGYLQVIIQGDFPHNTYCYQFGLPEEPASWFNAPAFGDIDLKLTEGGAAANSVLVQQPRSLP